MLDVCYIKFEVLVLITLFSMTQCALFLDTTFHHGISWPVPLYVIMISQTAPRFESCCVVFWYDTLYCSGLCCLVLCCIVLYGTVQPVFIVLFSCFI